jgi:hypothetical protein
MPDSTGITRPDDPRLRRIIVEHEVAPGSLLQRMSGIPSQASRLDPEPVTAHSLHLNFKPLGRVRARQPR